MVGGKGASTKVKMLTVVNGRAGEDRLKAKIRFTVNCGGGGRVEETKIVDGR